MKVSIVTPTFYRFKELPDYFNSIEKQEYLPFEIILVDGAPNEEIRSEEYINDYLTRSNLNIRYFRYGGGTAIQRNYGIDKAEGDLVLFLDDDVRIDENFISSIIDVFNKDTKGLIGGVTGYRKNVYFDMSKNKRWKLYKSLNFFTIYSPGKYDYKTGYPINNNGQPPFSGVREVDFMTTACTMYRNSILQQIQFDHFFIGFGVLEDAHLALKIKKEGYKLFQCGDAKAIELSSPSGRSSSRIVGERTAINYYYVFKDICKPLTLKMKFRFIIFQIFELFRAFIDVFRFRNKNTLNYLIGKGIGVSKVIFGKI
ncbi:glycosyltransferase family 2 protein [Flavobacterium sp.]|uniref:glycosyltransferase family 2 protein n=1 Tax=Flavobacterium sp. TaxID=239 RepID=UPI0040484A30